MLRLPSSPETLASDRFSLTDIETEEPIPFWLILREILTPTVHSTSQLIDVLDTIAMTLRGRADSDNGFLRRFLDEKWDFRSFFDKTWPRCVELALEMPTLFPDGYLEPLTSEQPFQSYTSRQITCLVIHQFLCTLPKLPWIPIDEEDNSQDLHIWYAGEQPHPKAVSAYLTAMFVFLERAAASESGTFSSTNPIISLTLYTAPSTPDTSPTTLFQLISISDLEMPSVDTSLLGLPSGACVISANRNIGFGRTASQEEMHVGCTPQSLPAKLFAPPLEDTQVMVLRGCEAVIELAGYARTAELASIIPPRTHDWSRRTMLFMDALELDGHDTSSSTPDLLPGNIDRELTKAYTAFASYGDAYGTAPYDTVVTGHWGCGAFGGNREIKSIIQWCAASMAGIRLNFVCDKDDPFASNFRGFTSEVLSRGLPVHTVLTILRKMPPTDEGRLSAFRHVLGILDGQSL
ncbi:hypothetical protein B0H19DRAFT_1042088 [Mycena capillaripes]|nr:hypothetical protein B0H19DRAFT_1042088 [Mycena capillaripes]